MISNYPMVCGSLIQLNLLVLYVNETCVCHWTPNDYKLRWMLADFGFSTAVHDDETKFSDTQRGSMRYRAPELANKQFSRKSDVWSIGCILYRLVTKRDAFLSDDAAVKYANGSGDRLPQIDKGTISSIGHFKTICPEKLNMISFLEQINSIISLCLHPDPLARATAMQLKIQFEMMKIYLTN